ncbi:glutamate/aspartate transport system substrate-binding protein [Pseudomonas libanensis]|uniref:transporter substrate-binding domain-containing protein n=1 Tax=Pseudomonas libanensis TaxID=75588 RepID=UPI00087CF8F2|nr:transporter substrate-binding domain-containing protein [Pseudomonas libanensis]SDL30911.1 glutamate/aspartate transport system substrate-binding protein [Pseudomonas libanensis]
MQKAAVSRGLFKACIFASLALGLPLASASESSATLKKITASQQISVGYRDASVPFSYIGDQSGKPMGYSVDLTHRIVERVREQAGLKNLRVNYRLVTSQTRIPLVQNGTVDLECGSTGVTAERQTQVAFSYGFIYVKGQLLTARTSGIHGLPDLKGKNVVTTAGTTNERFLKRYNAEHQSNMFVISAKDHGEAFKMLETGRAVAFYMDDALLYGERAKARDPHHWVVVGKEQSREIYSCMVRKDDPQFLAVVNQALGDLYRSGAINGIYQRWFEQPIPPNGLNLEFPMTSELKAIIASPVSDPVD